MNDLKKPRCTNCGSIENNCCDNENKMTWEQLVELERLTFSRLLRAELRLEEKYATKDEIKKTLDEIARFKQPSLWDTPTIITKNL